jgi:hypothetical protein
MPPKQKEQFEFIENLEKPLADSTLASYKRHLNLLAKEGFKNREDLLNNSPKVVETIKRIGTSKVKRNFLYAAVFYITGRLDLISEPRGVPLYNGFQENYKSK